MNLKCCQKSGLKVIVLLKNWGKRVNKEPFLQDSSICIHHRNSVYEFDYQKLCELNLNYNSGQNFKYFLLLICDGDSYRYTAFYMALLHTEGARGYK